MYLNQFGLRVEGGKESHSGYVKMKDGQRFVLVLRNDWSESCNATVMLNGITVGTWRIESRSKIRLERGVQDDGYFTFFAADSAGGQAAGVAGISPELRGLVQVTFVPGILKPVVTKVVHEHHYHWWPIDTPKPHGWDRYYSTDGNTTCCRSGSTDDEPVAMAANSAGCYHTSSEMGAGVVGLSGSSDQTFGVAHHIDLDYTRQTTISLRLVEDQGGNEEIDARPVVAQGNPVPPHL